MQRLGVEPFDNDGSMRITLTSQSADALAKAEGLRTWAVAPTMVRGSKNVAPKAPRAFAARKRRQKLPTRVPGLKKGKKRKPKGKKNAEPISIKEPEAHDFRRNSKGKALISQELAHLRTLDAKAFPDNPIFDDSGKCRMKYAVEKAVSLEQILEHGPDCIVSMLLESIKAFSGSGCFYLFNDVIVEGASNLYRMFLSITDSYKIGRQVIPGHIMTVCNRLL